MKQIEERDRQITEMFDKAYEVLKLVAKIHDSEVKSDEKTALNAQTARERIQETIEQARIWSRGIDGHCIFVALFSEESSKNLAKMFHHGVSFDSRIPTLCYKGKHTPTAFGLKNTDDSITLTESDVFCFPKMSWLTYTLKFIVSNRGEEGVELASMFVERMYRGLKFLLWHET